MKIKALLTFATILASFHLAQAQDAHVREAQAPTVAKNLFKFNLLSPGFEYERGLTETSTLNITTNMGFSLGYSNNTGFNTYLYPSLGLQARKYYNLDKRLANGENVAYNAGNFLALNAFGSTPSIIKNENTTNEASYGVGPVWGMQRNYRSGLNFTLIAGLAYTKDNFGDKRVAPQLGLNLGFLIGRK